MLLRAGDGLSCDLVNCFVEFVSSGAVVVGGGGGITESAIVGAGSGDGCLVTEEDGSHFDLSPSACKLKTLNFLFLLFFKFICMEYAVKVLT